MSDYVAYDFEQFVLERAEVTSAALGEFIVGESALGAEASSWVTIPVASFSTSAAYAVDPDGTLIVDAESASVAIAFWGTPADVPLYPSDRVRATYAGLPIFLGTVDSTEVIYAVDDEAVEHGGATHRMTFTATIAGTYAAALGKKVCWEALPEESAIDRIRRWITVDGW